MLILLQPDLEKAVQFYEDLGLKKKFHLKEKWAEFDLDGISIGLCPVDPEKLTEKGIDPSTGFRTGIVLEVDDLRALCSQRAESMTFLGEPVEAVHGLMVSFRDPGGNIMDLYQPTPEKLREFVKKSAQKEQEEQGPCCCDK